MGRRNYFPKDEGFSSSFLRQGGTETPEQEAERRMAYDLENLQIEQGITQSMANLVNIEREKTKTALEQRVLQHSSSVLPILESLDPAADDYETKVAEAFRGNPYATQDRAVSSLLEVQDKARDLILSRKTRADEIARVNAEKRRVTAESVRAGVSQLGADYLNLYDEAVNSGLDPVSANARVASREQSDKLRVMLQQSGLSEEEILPLRNESGDVDPVKAQAALTQRVPKDEFMAASKIVKDINDRVAAEGITYDELPMEEREQLLGAKAIQRAYLQQVRKRIPAGEEAEVAATAVADETPNVSRVRMVRTADGKWVPKQ